MASDLNKMAAKINKLENDVAKIRTRSRPSYSEGFLADMMMYPGMLGMWPCTSRDNGNLLDVSGHNRTLFKCGNPAYPSVIEHFPYIMFNGLNQYFSGPPISVTGEMTIGGWFNINVLRNAGLIGQYGCEYGYMLGFDEHRQALEFAVSNDGATYKYATSYGGETITDSIWYFVAGRFVPSTSIDIFVNTNKYSDTASIYASIYDSKAPFCVGVYGFGYYYFNGFASFMFLYNKALSDEQLKYIYNKSKVMYDP